MASFLIPHRPQTKHGNRQGAAYFALCKETAQDELKRSSLGVVAPAAPLVTRGFIAVTLDLYFAASLDAPAGFEDMPERWDEFHIPRADAAAGLTLSALKGYLYASSRQVQPLTVNRFVKSRDFLAKTFGQGCKRGCVVVHYAPSVFDFEAEAELVGR